MKLISMVSPCINEEENGQKLHDYIAKVMGDLNYDMVGRSSGRGTLTLQVAPITKEEALS